MPRDYASGFLISAQVRFNNVTTEEREREREREEYQARRGVEKRTPLSRSFYRGSYGKLRMNEKLYD
jgi:hypothetical protein